MLPTGATDVEVDQGGPSNPELDLKTQPSRKWEIDVRGLISTKAWLSNYGLKKNRLDMHHILPQIGFKHSDNFDVALKRPVASKYGAGLFQKYFRPDGKTFNISCGKEKLKQIEQRLCQAIHLYKRRLDWLTSESRRIFGVMEEKSIAIVLDIKNMSPQQFDQYRTALERVIREQVSQLAKFNLIRATEDINMYRPDCVPVTSESLDAAVEWMWSLDRTGPVSKTATTEAVLKALADPHIEAVYIYTEGSAIDGARELLKEKLTGARAPVHVVSYNCVQSDTMRFLKDLCKVTGGRLHAYAVVMEMDAYEPAPQDPATNQANVILKRRTYGGVPPGAGMREDVITLFEEMETARNILGQMQALIREIPDPKSGVTESLAVPRNSVKSSATKSESNLSQRHSIDSARSLTSIFQSCPQPVNRSMSVMDKISDMNGTKQRSETYMSSREWLSRHGLKAKKLGFYDVLANVAFKHRDGVVDLKHCPGDDIYQTDAMNQQKLVNAKYCDKFPCVRWKDGEVVHVQVTPEMHRGYESRMKLTLEAMQQRIDWLQQGSRELFGTVIEDNVYIIIDTSASMSPHIQFVKDKLFVLMQEQLRHKQKFNLICFDTKACAWRDRLMEVNEKNLSGAWSWIKALQCRGSTNTMAALRMALADHQTQAIYLLTDGRPDQQPKSILAQVQLHPQVPVHTISFNCSDREANQFLCELAKETGGRFHYYSENGVDHDGPEPWESEDIRLLRHEMENGYSNLQRIALLRDECGNLAWRKEGCSAKNVKESYAPAPTPRHLYRGEYERPQSAPGFHVYATPPSRATPRPATAHSHRSPTANKARSITRPASARPSYSTSSLSLRNSMDRSNVAGHTKTSILRTLTASGVVGSNDWLLPETKELFEKQWDRQKGIDPVSENKKNTKKKGRKLKKNSDTKLMSSKKWLSTHGLVPKKLTILDALSPTIIPHRPKYVPILNKHVLSKVFDDVLPIAHASGDRKSVRIVNPQGVDLRAYVAKLEKMMKKYKKRLDELVWNALPSEEKEEFEGDGPVSFADNRNKLMKALDKCGWPVRERDIYLLEAEIRQAEVYIQQAENLIDAAKNGGKFGSEASDDEVSIASSGCSTPREQESVKKGKKSKVHSGGKAGKLKSSSSSNNKNDSAPPSAAPRGRRVGSLSQGNKVIGRHLVDGFYYPGTVIRSTDRRHTLVDFGDIGQQTVPTRFIIPMSGAVPRPTLSVGDYVLCRVINQDTGLECYVPGIIQVTPPKNSGSRKFHTVILYTGQQDQFLRGFLVKIAKMRYTLLVRYLGDLAKQKEEADEDTSRKSGKHVTIKDRSRSPSSVGSSRGHRSRSSSNSRSRSPSADRKGSKEALNRKRGDNVDGLQEEMKRLEAWQKELKKQQRKQEKEQKKLKKQAKELAKFQKKLAESRGQPGEEDHEKLLQMILNEISQKESKKSSRKSDKQGSATDRSGGRTQEWVFNQSKDADASSLGESQEGSPPFILELRQTLPALDAGEEVLARWADEGWYYRGIVRQDCGDGSYFVEDGIGDLERIWREDIIGDRDDADIVLQRKDAVVALHPSYSFSYAPAVVLDVEADTWFTVRLYDGVEGRLPREEVFRIHPEKFERDVSYIVKCEDQWVQQVVVARHDDTGIFQLGVVTERVGNGRQYVVEWASGKVSIQSSAYIFGALTRRHPLAMKDCVLAMCEEETFQYLPGRVSEVSGGKVSVQFCDGTENDELDPNACFWLSSDYYDEAVEYYNTKRSQPITGSASSSSDVSSEEGF